MKNVDLKLHAEAMDGFTSIDPQAFSGTESKAGPVDHGAARHSKRAHSTRSPRTSPEVWFSHHDFQLHRYNTIPTD